MAIGDVEYTDRELPVPPIWRPTFHQIVLAFSEGDFSLARGITSVKPIPRHRAEDFARYVDNYGATLTALPDETWRTSVYLRDGDFWQVLVDLFTVEEGRSDLVLFTRVHESGDLFVFEPWSLHVP